MTNRCNNVQWDLFLCKWTCREINSLHIVASVGHSIEYYDARNNKYKIFSNNATVVAARSISLQYVFATVHCYELRCKEDSFFTDNKRMLWSSCMFEDQCWLLKYIKTFSLSASLISFSWRHNNLAKRSAAFLFYSLVCQRCSEHFVYNICLTSFGTDACRNTCKSKKSRLTFRHRASRM